MKYILIGQDDRVIDIVYDYTILFNDNVSVNNNSCHYAAGLIKEIFEAEDTTGIKPGISRLDNGIFIDDIAAIIEIQNQAIDEYTLQLMQDFNLVKKEG